MTFIWTDILTFPAIFQGFLIALVLIRLQKANKIANYFLAGLIVCCTISLLGKLMYTRVSFSNSTQIALVFDTIIFLFCPFIYLFIKKLLFYDKNANWVFYLIPAAIHLLLSLYFLTIGNQHFISLAQTGEILTLFYFIEGSGVFINFYFLYKSYQLSRIYLRQTHEVLSFNQDLLYFLHIFLLVTLFCMLCWLVSFLSVMIFHRQLPYINYDTMWFAVPFLTYIVGYYMLAKPEIFRIELEKKSNNDYSEQENSFVKIIDSEKLLQKNNQETQTRKRLTHQEIENLKQKIETEFNQKQIFLEENLTLYVLAEKLDSSTNDLSWLLNTVYQKTFYDFVNEFRLNEFLSKIDSQEHKQKTILALAMEAGFNSKSTFNKVFKSTLNSTPSAYIKNQSSLKVQTQS